LTARLKANPCSFCLTQGVDYAYKLGTIYQGLSLSIIIVKVIPSNGSASESQATIKRLKVICGANTSTIADGDWIGDKTPLTLCDIRVSPNNSVKPNVGTNELAEALARVLPFTARDDDRPVLACVNFVA
ncbi:unnamed protein product, partial [marine sediment metagenome]